MSNTDRIEKQIRLRAPIARVWRAISDSDEFGRWFRMKLEAPFVPGATVRGKITHPGYEHLSVEMQIEQMDAPALFVYRWHPGAVDINVDYSKEPTTRVEFRLREEAGGTLLTIVESGFDPLPSARRKSAFRGNEQGWAQQLKNIEKHVADA